MDLPISWDCWIPSGEKDAVVNRVIKEQIFACSTKWDRQRQHIVRHHEVNARRQNF